MTPDRCPNCHADLNYELDGRPASHAIGVQLRGVYDGVLFWQCPFCDHQWPRFEIGYRLHDEAMWYIWHSNHS